MKEGHCRAVEACHHSPRTLLLNPLYKIHTAVNLKAIIYFQISDISQFQLLAAICEVYAMINDKNITVLQ